MSESNRRQFARIRVRLGARYRIVAGQEAEDLERELLEAPSVWAPEGESELLKLATRSGSGSDGLLAQAILDVSRQIGKLSHHILDRGGPAAFAEFHQLSGSGGLLSTHAALSEATRLDLRLSGDDIEAPPVRIVAEVLRGQPAATDDFPLRFRSIHPTDQERLIRFIHSLQRRKLRRASLRDG